MQQRRNTSGNSFRFTPARENYSQNHQNIETKNFIIYNNANGSSSMINELTQRNDINCSAWAKKIEMI